MWEDTKILTFYVNPNQAQILLLLGIEEITYELSYPSSYSQFLKKKKLTMLYNKIKCYPTQL